ncbi:MAG: hypothetical protein Tsb002_10510 [Wenzhouxiangellaceae bacterium]
MKILRWGGVAALFEAFAYLLGFSVLLLVLQPADEATMSALDKMTFALQHKTLLHYWNSVIYVFFGAALVVLVVAMQRLYQLTSGAGAAIASAFGLIWAGLVIAAGMLANVGLAAVAEQYQINPQQALYVWQTINVVQDGLGGGVEFVGGLWVLLLSVLGLRVRHLPPVLNLLGLLVGLAGILTVMPGLDGLGALFGLGQIVWFVYLGVVLLRLPSTAIASHGVGNEARGTLVTNGDQ